MSCSILGVLYHLNCSRTPPNVCGALCVNQVLISNPLCCKAKTPCSRLCLVEADMVFQEGLYQWKHPGPWLLFHFRSEYVSLTDPGIVVGWGMPLDMTGLNKGTDQLGAFTSDPSDSVTLHAQSLLCWS